MSDSAPEPAAHNSVNKRVPANKKHSPATEAREWIPGPPAPQCSVRPHPRYVLPITPRRSTYRSCNFRDTTATSKNTSTPITPIAASEYNPALLPALSKK